MTEHEVYLEGILFAARAWNNPKTPVPDMLPDSMQRQFNGGYMDATLWLLCGKWDLNMALLKTREQQESGAILIREAA